MEKTLEMNTYLKILTKQFSNGKIWTGETSYLPKIDSRALGSLDKSDLAAVTKGAKNVFTQFYAF